MKKMWLVVLVGASALMAQSPNRGSSYAGSTWVGLLVSGSCPAGKQAMATEEADRTVGARVTTPAVDSAGTRGSAEPGDNLPATKGNVPQTGDVSIANSGKIRDAGWSKARRQAASLHGSCRVSSTTKQFGLMMPDGSMMPFDDVANGKIADQLQSTGGTGAGKILRVQVVGKIQGGRLALDEIQM